MQDTQIIDLYWERDERAIEESATRYGAYCRQIAMNILVNREDTEECVNDTWLRAWDHMPPQRPGSLSAFFGRIVRNLSISRFRSNRAAKRFDGFTVMLSELEDCVPAPESVQKAVESSQITEIINEWLALQSKDDRILFVQRYWYGETATALAKKGRMTQNQMAQRMLRLRKSLKKALETEGVSL